MLNSCNTVTKASTSPPLIKSHCTHRLVALPLSVQTASLAVVFPAETAALAEASTAAELRPPVQRRTAQLSTRTVGAYTPPYGRPLASRSGTSLRVRCLQTSRMAILIRQLGARR